MPNPYVLLAGLVAALLTFAGGVYVGVRWEQSDNAKAIIVAQDAAIKSANESTKAAIASALESANKEANARLAGQKAKHAGELDALRKSRPGCARDSESMGLLSEAIDTANGQAKTSGSVPSIMRPAGKASGWFGIVNPQLGIPGSGSIWPVSPPAR